MKVFLWVKDDEPNLRVWSGYRDGKKKRIYFTKGNATSALKVHLVKSNVYPLTTLGREEK